jgi:hypothetical protein
MIPASDESLSFLMGAAAISDGELAQLGISIVQGAGSAFRGLLIPAASLAAYKTLVREKITAGFWNDIVGRQEIFFIFKLVDGAVRELVFSAATQSEIAHLCSALNQDPIEKTSDIPRYLAGNPFYRELIAAFHASLRRALA